MLRCNAVKGRITVGLLTLVHAPVRATVCGMNGLREVLQLAAAARLDVDDLSNHGLRDLGDLHKALNAALAEVREALVPALQRAAVDGLPQQRMAELAGYSIQAVRKIVIPGARDKHADLERETRRLARAARNAQRPAVETGPQRVVVTDDATEAFVGVFRGGTRQ